MYGVFSHTFGAIYTLYFYRIKLFNRINGPLIEEGCWSLHQPDQQSSGNLSRNARITDRMNQQSLRSRLITVLDCQLSFVLLRGTGQKSFFLSL